MAKYAWMIPVLLLAGCAAQPTVWQKTGASAADQTNALNSCTATATQKFPEDLQQVQVSAGYNQASGSGCGFTPSSGTQACSSGGAYVQPQTRMKDVNEDARNQAVAACMTAQGWSQQ